MVDAFLVEQSSVSENVEVPGTLFPFEETQIRAETGGRIIKLNIEEGATVAKGTLLVKIFDQDLQAQLQKFEAHISSISIFIREVFGDYDFEINSLVIFSCSFNTCGITSCISSLTIM